MNNEPDPYNLLEKPWIPVLWSNGTTGRVGIRIALSEAGRIRQIAASNPMDRVAILRLLLVILHWCKPHLTERERADLQHKKRVPEEWIGERLGPHEDPHAAFNILGDPSAFFQVLPASAKPNTGVTALLHEAPSGTNKAHFRHMQDDTATLCLACCALGLTRVPVFTASKGSGNFPGINQKPPVYFFPQAPTLFDTFLYNWPMQRIPDDKPAWDTLESTISEHSPIGIMNGFTWLPRRLRIVRTDRKISCDWCGSRDFGSRALVMIKPDKDDVERVKRQILEKKWSDPQVAYLKEPQRRKDNNSIDTGSFHATDCLNNPWKASGEWKDIWALMASSASGEHPEYVGPPTWFREVHGKREATTDIQVEAVGFATDGQATFFDIWGDSFLFSSRVMGTSARKVVVDEIKWLSNFIDATLDGRTAAWKKQIKELDGAVFLSEVVQSGRKGHSVRSAMSNVRPNFENQLRKMFEIFVDTLNTCPSTEWNELFVDWRLKVQEYLSSHLKFVLASSIPGSGLVRQECLKQLDKAIQKAVTQCNEKKRLSRSAGREKLEEV